jgi:signal transduction histidine kinase
MGISLRSGQDERVLVLEVHDDGPGFVLEGRSLGAGLQNMNDRVAAVGGELTIDTGPGDGTWVRAQAPIPAEVVALSPPPIPGGR